VTAALRRLRRRPRYARVLTHSPARSHIDVKPGATVVIGSGVAIEGGFALASYGAVIIDDGAAIGPYVQVLDSDLHHAGRHHVRPEPRPVRIGRGAVIGAWSTLLPGAQVGDGAVVDPYSVVSGSVADGSRVGGNPAVAVGPAAVVNVDATSPELVGEVMRVTFGLAEAPEPSVTRHMIDGWSSLGAVRLLVALTDATGKTLPDAEVLAATTVADLAATVDRARRR